eukprot:TRINITY_DN1478_c0_g1_i4.p1 TRINITY_DN1478_c0_g1~~TRINITY_DN1478_c0_g1_i4.p1  ORF type:complete len:611 (+),score=94.76 TRINITY_DN1478_c0_g1_i4:833-2665(+)
MKILENADMRYAVELLHTNRPLYQTFDYIYLIFDTEEQMNNWAVPLRLVCNEQAHSAASKPSRLSVNLSNATVEPKSARDRMKEMWTRNVLETTEDGVKGWVQIQREDNRRTRARSYCIISGPTVSFYSSDKLGVAPTDQIDAYGCAVAIVPYDLINRYKHALKLYKAPATLTVSTEVASTKRRAKHFDVVFNCDYLVLLADTDSQRDLWVNALQNSIILAQEAARVAIPKIPSRPSSRQNSDDETKEDLQDAKLDKVESDNEGSGSDSDSQLDTEYESADWFNAILARAFLNFRSSEEFKEKFKKRMFAKLLNKIKEKKADSYIGEVAVLAVDLGEAPPVFNALRLVPQSSTSEMGIDAWVRYKGGMMVKLGSNIHVGWGTNKTIIPFTATAVLKSLSGKLFIHFPCWPAERCSMSFYKEPDMNIQLQLIMGERNRSLTSIPRLNEMMLNKLRVAFLAKLVMPNRKYVRLFPPRTIPADSSTTTAATATTSTVPTTITTTPAPVHTTPAIQPENGTVGRHPSLPAVLSYASLSPTTQSSDAPIVPVPLAPVTTTSMTATKLPSATVVTSTLTTASPPSLSDALPLPPTPASKSTATSSSSSSSSTSRPT